MSGIDGQRVGNQLLARAHRAADQRIHLRFSKGDGFGTGTGEQTTAARHRMGKVGILTHRRYHHIAHRHVCIRLGSGMRAIGAVAQGSCGRGIRGGFRKRQTNGQAAYRHAGSVGILRGDMVGQYLEVTAANHRVIANFCDHLAGVLGLCAGRRGRAVNATRTRLRLGVRGVLALRHRAVGADQHIPSAVQLGTGSDARTHIGVGFRIGDHRAHGHTA